MKKILAALCVLLALAISAGRAIMVEIICATEGYHGI